MSNGHLNPAAAGRSAAGRSAAGRSDQGLSPEQEQLLALLLEEAEQVAAGADTAQSEGADDGSLLVPLQRAGRGPALFAVGVFHFRSLALHLGTARPFYGMLGQDVDPDADYLGQVETLAARYVEEARRVQPVGPYFLIGYCFGGLVAYEMACQLKSAGEPVAFLGLIDTVNPRAFAPAERREAPTVRERLQEHWERLQEEGFEHLDNWRRTRTRYEWVRAKMAAKRVLDRTYGVLGAARPGWLEGTATFEAEAAAAAAYDPPSYDGRVTVFACSPAAREGASAGGWDRVVTGDMDVVGIDSQCHMDVLEEPRVQVLAAALCSRLERAVRRPAGDEFQAPIHPMKHDVPAPRSVG